ncbi:MAG: hypothetical protein V9G19_27395 [Tetrasphaera sp.]
MAFSLRRSERTGEIPDAIRAALGLLPRERILASAQDTDGTWVAVGTARLYAVPAAGEVLARPWHLVDTGSWDHDHFTLTITWVDGSRPQQWVFRNASGLLAAFRERVQASVVLSESVPVGARQARVVIRKNLADGTLHDQTILGKGMRMSDPEVAQRVGDTRARLREQVGLGR